MSKKLKIIIPIIVVILLVILFLFLILNKSEKEDVLKGLWDIDGNTKYEFDGKGNGKLIVPNNEYIFSYTIKDNIISIDFENETSIDVDYEYEINKDELEITNKKETHLKFKLKKVDDNK